MMQLLHHLRVMKQTYGDDLFDLEGAEMMPELFVFNMKYSCCTNYSKGIIKCKDDHT